MEINKHQACASGDSEAASCPYITNLTLSSKINFVNFYDNLSFSNGFTTSLQKWQFESCQISS